MISWQGATPKQRIERWQNVLRVLRGLTPHQRKKHWDMSVWGKKTECGTVACAAGHCALDPWFTRRGFKMIWDPDGDGSAWPGDFFGYVGTSRIFLNPITRPVSAVIQEVKDYIEELKEQLEEDEAT